jgi:two-component system sensor histidine kinase EvgS
MGRLHRPLLGTAVETFVHTASAKGLLLTQSTDERLAAAHVGDPLRLRQILSNLLSNAVKFTEVGGIEVAARVLDESTGAQTVEFSVTDTGVGIPPDRQQYLFEDFAQADAATAQRYGGTGLGLVICKRLATLMGGDVTLESAPGTGTTMRLTVPLPLGDPSEIDPSMSLVQSTLPATRPTPSREQAEREGSLVLLAEDHPVNRTVLIQQLDIIGFQADTAADGQEALEKFDSGRYALVLTDLNMPRLDGYELARAVRRHERQAGASRTPIIALTANVMQGEPEKCREAGMDDFAAKPTTIPFLGARLRRWLPHLEWPVQPAAPPDENGAGSTGGLDSAVLDELAGGDAGLAASVLNDFVETSRGDLRALRDAAAASDSEQVRRGAHRVKGAGRIVGATEVAALAQELESAAAVGRVGDAATIHFLIAGLDSALAKVDDITATSRSHPGTVGGP